MISFSFEVPGKPLPWQRTASHRGRKLTPETQRDYQRLVQWAALAARPAGWPLDARYQLEVNAYCTPRQRGDLDNIAKQIGDAGNRVIWADDRRIDALAISRHIDRERPRVEVHVIALEPGEVVEVEMRVRRAE